MDNKALAETYVELYRNVCDSYEKRIGNQPTTEEAGIIYESMCRRIISDLIGKQRSGVPTQKESKPKSNQQCTRCGKYLTDGELKYIKDTDSEQICYKCSH